MIDEFALLNEQVFREGIKPLMVVQGTVMLAITTPRARTFVNDIAAMKNPDGSSTYNVIHKTTVCSDCKKLPTLRERVSCRHVKMPAWKNRDEQLANLEYGLKSGTLELAAQEECGIVLEDSDGYVYPSKRINEIFDLSNEKMRYYEDYVPKRIFVVCDPNADGASYTAVMSGFWAKNDKDPSQTALLVILGMDLVETKGSEREKLIKDHIMTIRTMNYGRYLETLIVFVPENNSGHAIIMEEAVSELQGVITFYQPGKTKPGVEKTNALTRAYCESLTVGIEADVFRFSKNFFTLSHGTAAKLRYKKGIYLDKDEEVIVDELKAQVGRIKKTRIANSDNYRISGKDGADKQDDGAVALWMLYYCSKAVEDVHNNSFKHIRNKSVEDNARDVYNLSQIMPMSQKNITDLNPKTLNLELYK